MSILKKLYNGNINPSEKFIKADGDYKKVNDNLVENLEKLIKTLNCDEKKLFRELESNVLALSSINQEEAYIDGFCTGAKVILEILFYKSKNFT